MSRIRIAELGLAVLLLIPGADALAYQYWSNEVNDVGQCAGCHGAFREGTYSSVAEGISWGDDLHAIHLGETDVESAPNGSCDTCHGGTGTSGRQVDLARSADAKDGVNAMSCLGCHGRLEDANSVTFFGDGWGAGLRQHHFTSTDAGAAAACGGCHADSNPANFTTVGQHFSPPWYASVTHTDTGLAMDPCNASANEDYSGDGTGLDNDGDQAYDLSDSDCPAPARTPGDLGYDGRADILWRNIATGQNWLYQMSGVTIDDSSPISIVGNTNWSIVGNGDYDGNGTADILWRNTATGQNWMHLMAGTRLFSSVPVNVVGDQSWTIVANGDYDGDGKSDIFWRNTISGQNWLYLMNGANIASSVAVNVVGDTNWQVVGSGDYNGDTRSDILWRNMSTGQNWVYLMNGASFTGMPLNVVSNQNWQVVGSGDYDGDGDSDILWRESQSGQNWMYLMNAGAIFSSEFVNWVSNPQWQVVGSGDYNGDGNSDILWREATTGQNWLYTMSGSSINSSLPINIASGVNWTIINKN